MLTYRYHSVCVSHFNMVHTLRSPNPLRFFLHPWLLCLCAVRNPCLWFDADGRLTVPFGLAILTVLQDGVGGYAGWSWIFIVSKWPEEVPGHE